jgi:hypothetical protein
MFAQSAQRMAYTARIPHPNAAARRAPYRIRDRGLAYAFGLSFFDQPLNRVLGSAES